MKICMNCKKEMFCKKNGVLAVFNGSHCYAGDEFACDACGARVLVCGTPPFHVDNALEKTNKEYLLDMSEAKNGN